MIFMWVVVVKAETEQRSDHILWLIYAEIYEFPKGVPIFLLVCLAMYFLFSITLTLLHTYSYKDQVRCIESIFIFENSNIKMHIAMNFCSTGLEWSESSRVGLWEPRINTQTSKATEASPVGPKWTGPKKSEIPQNDRPEQRHNWRPQVEFETNKMDYINIIFFFYLWAVID